jgi:hypothetical protein
VTPGARLLAVTGRPGRAQWIRFAGLGYALTVLATHLGLVLLVQVFSALFAAAGLVTLAVLRAVLRASQVRAS